MLTPWARVLISSRLLASCGSVDEPVALVAKLLPDRIQGVATLFCHSAFDLGNPVEMGCSIAKGICFIRYTNVFLDVQIKWAFLSLISGPGDDQSGHVSTAVTRGGMITGMTTERRNTMDTFFE
ncbi:Hypothetical predicted protein [Podarcis lilfordi]|uniref:Secreted protein n=1 Tax=Podarcis lilfordi TaxID=74358 RepID=A0AA35QPL7_9SAUR|nr:Hypothetical predicted protein [Podarcis lilfordi]